MGFYLEKNVKVFGAALDANDDPMKILTKCSYLNRLARGIIDINNDFADPYEALLKYSQVLIKSKFKKIGKLNIESWLRPKPEITDFDKLDPINFQKFTESGDIINYLNELEKFIKERILPDIPLMIGVDHSLTGGVIKALNTLFNPKDTTIIVFDAHFDGISAPISLDLARYAQENKENLNILCSYQLELMDLEGIEIKDSYTCASFLAYLIENNIIYPENLIIIGCQDYPMKEMRLVKDDRVKKYVKKYLSFEKQGVKFIYAADKNFMIKRLNEILGKLKNNNYYISVDVDVCIFKQVLAARFMNTIGIEKDLLLELMQIIQDFIIKTKSKLIGMDFMEIETHLLNKELKKSGMKDKTIPLIDEVLKIFF